MIKTSEIDVLNLLQLIAKQIHYFINYVASGGEKEVRKEPSKAKKERWYAGNREK